MRSGREPAALYDRSPGYGIVRFHRQERTITAESWPRWVDPTANDASQYPGWPVTVSQQQNYGRAAAGYLPTLVMTGIEDPVVKLIDESSGETVYTLRIQGASFRPKIFDLNTTYSVHVRDSDSGKVRVLSDLRPAEGDNDELKVVLED
jgi:hypothetical protein